MKLPPLSPEARKTLAGAVPTLKAVTWLTASMIAQGLAEYLRTSATELDAWAEQAAKNAEPHEAAADAILLT